VLSLHSAVGGFVVDGSGAPVATVVGATVGGGAPVPRVGCVVRADGCDVDEPGTVVTTRPIFAEVDSVVVLTRELLDRGTLVLAVFPLPPHEATATVTAATNMKRGAIRS
jgi:hypothetical protein